MPKVTQNKRYHFVPESEIEIDIERERERESNGMHTYRQEWEIDSDAFKHAYSHMV